MKSNVKYQFCRKESHVEIKKKIKIQIDANETGHYST